MPTPIIIERADQSPSPNFFLLVYVSIAGLNSLFTLVRAFLFAFGCVLAARRLHAQLLAQLLRASIAWWDRTPCGRVTNRLSSDVGIVDDALPFQLNIFLASMFALVGTLLVTVVALPLLSPLVVLLFPIYFFIQAGNGDKNRVIEIERKFAEILPANHRGIGEQIWGKGIGCQTSLFLNRSG
jgi:ABC-type multidrug transport system fused ATPase/permease subunit